MAGKGRVDPRVILDRRRKVTKLRLAGITEVQRKADAMKDARKGE